MSASSTPTFCPAAASAAARFTVTERAAGHGEVHLDPDLAIGTDVDALHHAELGDGTPDLRVVHPGQRGSHLLSAGRGNDGGCSHAAIVCMRAGRGVSPGEHSATPGTPRTPTARTPDGRPRPSDVVTGPWPAGPQRPKRS